MHTIAMKLLVIPPVVRTLIALFTSEWSFLFVMAHTLIHVKQPKHLFISIGSSIFDIFITWFNRAVKSAL